jgi:nitrite reductase/ring-hydroxylating ferredoxin subunit
VLVMFTVCPWHDRPYDVHTGRMTRGPQGIFAKIPGVGAANKALIVLLSLRRGSLTERDGRPFVK